MATSSVRAGTGGQREVDLRVPAIPPEVSHARHALEQLGLPPRLLRDAQLLVSELVTNSIKHSGTRAAERVRIGARWSGGTLRVDVYDRGDGADTSAVTGGIRPSPTGESGWGLFLLDRIATRWGRSRGHYWFELAASSPGEAATG